MAVGRADLVAAAREIVAKIRHNVVADRCFLSAGSRQKDRTRDSLRALHAFRMVVRHFRRPARDAPRFLQAVVEPACRRHAHRRAIAVAAVRIRIDLLQPQLKTRAIADVWIFSAPTLHGVDEHHLHNLFILAESGHQRFCHCDCHHRIVGKMRACAEQWKILHLGAAVKFVRRADHIAQNRSIHVDHSLFVLLIILYHMPDDIFQRRLTPARAIAAATRRTRRCAHVPAPRRRRGRKAAYPAAPPHALPAPG